MIKGLVHQESIIITNVYLIIEPQNTWSKNKLERQLTILHTLSWLKQTQKKRTRKELPQPNKGYQQKNSTTNIMLSGETLRAFSRDHE